jgi:signal transduction histidine kinase
MSRKQRAWAAWTIAAFATVMAIVGLGFAIASWRTPPPSADFGPRGFPGVLALEFAATGLILALKRPDNRMGWIFLVVALGSGFQQVAEGYAVWAVAGRGLTTVPARLAALGEDWIWILPFGTIGLALALFPEGHAISRRWSWWIGLCVAMSIVAVLGLATTTQPTYFADVVNPIGISGAYRLGNISSVFFLLLLVTGFASLIVRFRRSEDDEHEQMKWVAFSAAIILIAFGAFIVAFLIEGNASTPLTNLLELAVVVGVATIPISVGIGILRYRLYDVDVVISKTLVYGALAVLIALVYVVIVAGIGTVVGADRGPALSAVAAAVVAVAFQPARRRVQRVANRLVYGHRASPYEVLSAFAERLADSYSIDDVLPRLIRLLADGTGAEEVSVWLRVGADLRRAAVWPAEEERSRTLGRTAPQGRIFEVRHQGEELGAINVVMPSGEAMAVDQERLVSDVAAQAGLVLRNVRLIEDLKASRQRLVAAQDAERRRLERNLHDGAQQQLVALGVKARLAQQLARRDPAEVEPILGQIQADTDDALENLRDLARGIYPPLLADRGLVAALGAQARKAAVPTTVRGDGIGRFEQDVEAAVYFSCLEALQNVAKYAHASRAEIELSNGNGTLTFRVTDDGIGFDTTTTSFGTGLQGIADRLAAIDGSVDVRSSRGGGTTITGRVTV